MRSPFRHLLVALAVLPLAASPPARANTTLLGIEIDGNYTDDVAPEEDWFPGFPPRTDPFGQDDDTLCGTSPAPKNDITNFFLANDLEYLYLGMERLANTGQTSFFFSFDITGDGPSKGDFIFVFCFGSGTVVTDTFVLEWDEALQQFVQDSTPPTIQFQVNDRRIPAPFKAFDRKGRPQPFIDDGKFGEASIDLSSIEGFDICDAASVTAEVQTKSSCSLSSQCKDTSGPFIFSFEPLAADLELAQEDSCDPVITATANATSPRSPLVYRWFVDGVEQPGLPDQDQVSIPVPPNECGPHDIRVIVTDGTCEVEDQDTIDINVAPQAVLTRTDVGPCDLTLSYDGSSSSDCDGDPIELAWDFDGDQLPDSTDPSGTWVYPACGEKRVALVVSDGQCTSPVAAQAVYANAPPVAGLRVTPIDCLTVEIADTSVDCDLLQSSPLYTESLSRAIDLGDGATSTDPLLQHTYGTCGDYLLTLEETDAMGCTDTDQRLVNFTMSVTVR